MEEREVYEFIQKIIDGAQDSKSAGYAILGVAGIISREPYNKELDQKLRDLAFGLIDKDLKLNDYKSAITGKTIGWSAVVNAADKRRYEMQRREEERRRCGWC
ncbi:hypothetical protein [Butyrivibrio proteoclasticus]|uniref:hypothetical protein n=1 Tax=Butyrivibrio proteoclasticus TaxID=43305 RepID=UPI00047CE886|nr:hypothetical protein [Butyrivibrio proteoclasticus]